jgi:hypothetical protein
MLLLFLFDDLADADAYVVAFLNLQHFTHQQGNRNFATSHNPSHKNLTNPTQTTHPRLHPNQTKLYPKLKHYTKQQKNNTKHSPATQNNVE